MVVVDRFTKWAEFSLAQSLSQLKEQRPFSWRRFSPVMACQRRSFPTKEHSLCCYFSCHWLRRWTSNNACCLLSTLSLTVKQRGSIKFLSIILDATPQTPRTIGLTYCCWLCLPTTCVTTTPQRCPHSLQILVTIPVLWPLRRQHLIRTQLTSFLKLKATQQVLFDNLNKSVLTYKKFSNAKRAKGPKVKTDG